MIKRASAIILSTIAVAQAEPGPQWSKSPPQVRQWFQSLMQPDNPAQSCCGEADAVEADIYESEGDHYIAVITDGRGIVPTGTRIPVPNQKIKWDKGNPTGHGILFISGEVTIRDDQGYVYVMVDGDRGRVLYCYVPPSGV
jgi:hypothetical protein